MMRSVRRSRSVLGQLGAAFAAGALSAACSGGDDVDMGTTEDPNEVGGSATGGASSGGSDGTGASPANEGGASGGGPSAPAPGTPGGPPVTSVNPVPDGEECKSEQSDATLAQLDIFIMLDRSGSMDDPTAEGDSKWEEITSALDTFMLDPASAGIGAGFGLFSQFAGSSRDEEDVLCEPEDYAEPVVPIAPLETNAARISAAMGDAEPLQYTPTRPALAGAIMYASEWAAQNPTHRVLVVLATDGLPNVCDSTVESVVEVAEDGRQGTPSIPTYVIGVVGREDEDSVSNLNQFAEGGGTGTAFIVDPAGDAGGEFLNAMNSIRAANRVDCEFAIPAPPSGKAIDFTSVSVEYTPASGSPQPLSWVPGAAECGADSDGWYYDDNAAPSRVELCEGSCTTARADLSAKLSVVFGCSSGDQGGTGGTGAGGSGGSGGGGGGTGGGEPPCLLDGQSCETSDDCCGGQCLDGICVSIR